MKFNHSAHLIQVIVLAVLLIPSGASAAADRIKKSGSFSSESPNKISKVFGTVKAPGKGETVLYLSNGVSQKKVEIARADLYFQPEVQWFGEDAVQVRLWSSNQKSESIFFDLIQGKKSVEIANVVGVNGTGTIVANVDKDRLRLVSVFAMTHKGFYFGDNSIALDAAFPEGRPLLDVIKRAEFTPEGDFMMRFEVGEKVQMGVRVSASDIEF